MAESERITITVDEGQMLFERAAAFALPEKLGDAKYDIAERGLAAEDVRALWRELRGRSTLYQTKKLVLFGPADAWENKGIVGETTQYRAEHGHETTVKIRLTKEGRAGAFWCLLLALHPSSPVQVGASKREEAAWPLAEKLRLVGELRRETGLERARRRELTLDDPKTDGVETGADQGTNGNAGSKKVGVAGA